MNAATGNALSNYLKRSAAEINAVLASAVPPAETRPDLFHRAQRDCLLAPGKRLRGITVLAVTEMLGGSQRTALPLAAAVEMVHASSLALDDLPSMDDATLRRGQPTLHRVHGEANAILVAVALLTRGFELIGRNEQLSADVRNRAILSLTRAVGGEGLIAGQVVDLASVGKTLDLDALEYIHSHKTGALFIASAELGVWTAAGDERALNAVRGYAKNLGLAFQITDDLLDREGDPETTGKDTGLDHDKTTFVDVCGVEGAQRLVDELIQAATAALDPFGSRGAMLVGLAEMVRRRDR